MLAQQWAQAVLQEREQLAIELHDGLSQSLAFLNVQAQAAQLYLQTGQDELPGPVWPAWLRSPARCRAMCGS